MASDNKSIADSASVDMKKNSVKPAETVSDSRKQPQEGDIGFCGYILYYLSVFLIVITFPLSMLVSLGIIYEYQRVVIFRLGRLLSAKPKGPGIIFIVPCVDDYTVVDLRTISFDVPQQEILSKDSVTVAVDAVVYYRVQDPCMSVMYIKDNNSSTKLLAQTILRNVLGTKNLSEILTDVEHIRLECHRILGEGTRPWGILVERIEIKDVRLPINMQRAMAAEAEATREAKSKVIAAQGEEDSSKALKKAADVILSSPAALQLRYLQTLSTIAAEKNSTIIFPLPLELLRSYAR